MLALLAAISAATFTLMQSVVVKREAPHIWGRVGVMHIMTAAMAGLFVLFMTTGI